MVDRIARVRKPHDTIADALGVAILAGEIAPGSILDREIEASEMHNVSRGSYREAIRTLAAKGLVSSRPKAGTRVLERERWNLLDLDVLSWLFKREPDEKVLTDLFGMRRVVEPEAAALAARQWTETSIAPFRAAMEVMVSWPNHDDQWQIADKHFHDMIFRLADNVFLTALAPAISSAVRLSTIYKLRGRAAIRNSTIDHLRVYEAIVSRNEDEARAQMADLIRIALEETLDERRRALAEQKKASRARKTERAVGP